AEIDSKPVPAGHPAAVRAGEQLRIDSPTGGCRAWLAISGGVDVEPVLGSRSTDLRSGFGGFQGRALRDGDELSFGETSPRAKTLIQKLQRETIGRWAPPHEWSNPARRNPLLRFVRGRNIDLFDDALIERFTSQTFHVSPDSDRMGIRLNGTSLERVNKSDLLSEAVAPGTVQVPPGGHPIVLLNDCQTIGGYPKIAHVITVDLPVAAQVCPGDPVKFSEVSLTDAHTLLLTLEQKLQQFRRGLETVST
ncbi:MAG TPA: biotin-dependent carboxyltransferase family protein, partial [Chthoniobacterales bacterium]|nr:biotin-dependent carboxyltransferase family protein [Chthoniobacterales bacterium]